MSGLPIRHGAQLAVDTTLVSPLKASGEPRPRALNQEGAAMVDARKRKQRRYPELTGTRCHLVVTAMEVGGRWSQEAHDFIAELAEGKAQEAPRVLRGSAYRNWKKRWTDLVSVAGMRSFADTLLWGHARSTALLEGEAPELGQLLGNEPHEGVPATSLLGLRN